MEEGAAIDLEIEAPECTFEEGDNVVYPHHGAGVVLRKESKELLGEEREYLTIKILHNEMTVQVPCENAGIAGLRRVIGPEDVKVMRLDDSLRIDHTSALVADLKELLGPQCLG